MDYISDRVKMVLDRIRFYTVCGIYLNLKVRSCLLSHFSPVWLCKPMDCNPPGFSVHGIQQTRIPQWVAMASSSRYSWPRGWTHIFCGSCIAGRFFTPGHHESPSTVVKNLPANAGDTKDESSIPWTRRSPGIGNGNPIQHSQLENSMGRVDW